jgi:hypothetical protein
MAFLLLLLAPAGAGFGLIRDEAVCRPGGIELGAFENIRRRSPNGNSARSRGNPQAAAKVTTTYDALHGKTRQPEA